MDEHNYSKGLVTKMLKDFKGFTNLAKDSLADGKVQLDLACFGVEANPKIPTNVLINLRLLALELDRAIKSLDRITGDLPAIVTVINQKPVKQTKGHAYKNSKTNTRFGTLVSKSKVMPISKLTKDK